MHKSTKYILAIAVIGLLAYNSVYFKPLHEVKASADEKKFNVIAFSKDLMDHKMASVPAINIDDFFNRLKNDFDQLMEEQGRQLGVSDQRYFMVEGKGLIITVEEENMLIQVGEEEEQELRIATDFIFGNTLRDASGLVSISDYANTMDFNNISVEMNKLVKQNVILPILDQIKLGSEVIFKGATQINIKEPSLKDLRVIPVQLKIVEN